MTTDTERLEDRAQRALQRFESINPKDVPERFADLMLCLYGALRQQIRLAREIDLMCEMGHINVDVLLDQKTVTLTEQ
jgi:hypothetical protein